MKIVELNEWNKFIQSMIDSWDHRNKKKYCNVQYAYGVDRCVVLVNSKSGRTVVARCHKNDEFDSAVGLAIAWARYLGIKIPKCGTILHTTDIVHLKFGTKLYVHEKVCNKFWDHEMIFAGTSGNTIYLYDPDTKYTVGIHVGMFDVLKKDPDIMVFLPM